MNHTILHYESIVHSQLIDFERIISNFRYVNSQSIPLYYLVTIAKYSLNAKIMKELFMSVDVVIPSNSFTCIIKDDGTVLFYQLIPSTILLFQYSIDISMFADSRKQPVSNTAVIITRKSPQHAENQLNLQF